MFFSLKNILGFFPSNIAIYKLAFRHKSGAQDIKGIKNSNERLEYLGDAVLGAAVADMLFKRFPFREEGFLTEMRSKIVSRENLNRLAIKIGLQDLIQTSSDNNSRPRSIYGDAFEALIGAIYLDKGYKASKDFILNRIIKNHMDIDDLENKEHNFKSKIIEWAQKERKSIAFNVIEEIENKNDKLIKVHVIIGGVQMGQGVDKSKKRAEQIAAEETCKIVGI